MVGEVAGCHVATDLPAPDFDKGTGTEQNPDRLLNFRLAFGCFIREGLGFGNSLGHGCHTFSG
jgi:hypothetical protein